MLQLVWLTAGHVQIFLRIFMLSYIHVLSYPPPLFFFNTSLSFASLCYDFLVYGSGAIQGALHILLCSLSHTGRALHVLHSLHLYCILIIGKPFLLNTKSLHS
jgi:hypothetical protein